ncbi:flagellar assembly peptidoglycan hydrolase FlgJ [Reinekea marina]|uniref:Peptidoglycan hydrolase FlgJ n=1 Tax=Reinekea marina TaxID=1310421 RepID=A0ABV7WRX5_9GAMM|nr:flagellar assembly peptidoglycan hydrolase FlgJ [Reinekea marina]MDN3649226.1 flagellar assembly peptidoglycan hydrolase FlgJ [Reinekea marina]
MTAQLDAAFNYNDLQGLNTLKRGAQKDDPEALKAVAQQFESMFMNLIMKSMRDATDVLASDLESSYQTKFYRDMSDQQMALSMSRDGGFGLAEVLYEQLLSDKNPQRENYFDNNIKPLNESIRPILNASPWSFGEASIQSVPESNPENLKSTEGDIEEVYSSPSYKSLDKDSFSSPESFIKQIMPIAEQTAKLLGVQPQVLVAQAALETGWGKKLITNESGEVANNFFGIKADQRWNGQVAMTTTHEYIDGNKLTVKAPFRAYGSIEESFNDYAQFLKSSSRYQTALEQAKDPEVYLNELQTAGYATDPQYAEKIIRIVNSDWFKQA